MLPCAGEESSERTEIFEVVTKKKSELNICINKETLLTHSPARLL